MKFKLFICVTTVLPCFVFASNLITLEQAETYAIKHSPEISQFENSAKAYAYQSIADAQFPDPKLSLGAMNVPVDTFSFTQESMTQIQVGLMQKIPKGNSLEIKAKKDNLSSQMMDAKKKIEELKIRKTIRLAWLELYYRTQSQQILKKEEEAFAHLAEVTRGLYENHQAKQEDIIRAKYEQTQLQEQQLEVNHQIAEIKAILSHWINKQESEYNIVLPSWDNPEGINAVLKSISSHPIIKSDQLANKIGKKSIELSEQDYKPGYSVGVAYGLRQGEDSMGKRTDFVGAQVTVDLPVFTGKRQDNKLKMAEEKYSALQNKEVSDYRMLVEQVNKRYSDWMSLSKQYSLYHQEIIHHAEHFAESTMVAYQNNETDFSNLAKAYIEKYKTQINALKVQVDKYKARAELQFLQGR